jgi:two-component system sensor histidine kinase HydH
MFSVVAAISAFGTYRISIKGSRHLLETRALDMAVNIGFTIENIGVDNSIFHKLAMQDKWEELAFIALFDRDGRIIMHSNSFLVGAVKGDRYVQEVVRNEQVTFHDSVLGTGEDVFVLDFPLKLHLKRRSEQRTAHRDSMIPPFVEMARKNAITQAPEARTYCLRVALHTYPARFIVRQANFQLVMIGVSLLALWILALFVISTWRRNINLEQRLAEQERMAVLGRMAAVLAHEIRNPLSSIKGFAQIHCEDDSDPDLAEDMEIIVEETERLEHLTENLLTYAKPVTVRRVEFDLDEFCNWLEHYWKYDDNSVSISVSCSGGRVFHDRDKLTLIIRNLVQNAVDATQKAGGGEIKVLLEKSDNALRIDVIDRGTGISPEDREKLFEPFFTTRTKGTGLGLAIVKRLVDLMNGSIEVSDNPDGAGTVFSVILPDNDTDTDNDGNRQ